MNMGKTASTIMTINKKIINMMTSVIISTSISMTMTISTIIHMIIHMVTVMTTATRVTITENNTKVSEWKLPFFMLYVIFYEILSRRHPKYRSFDLLPFHFLFRLEQRRSCWGMERLALFWPSLNLHLLSHCDRFDLPNRQKLLLSHHGIHSQYRYGTLN